MQIGIVCKVIDNFGDAGFSLRLAKALACASHDVQLFHDHPPTFQKLYPVCENPRLTLQDLRDADIRQIDATHFDLFIEPFGTSSEHTEHRFDLALKKNFPTTPWLVVDYLSAEDWVENFHLTKSVNPATGHFTTYFYPGFTKKTGGLIHCDYPEHLKNATSVEPNGVLSIFVFSYSNSPLEELAKWSIEQNENDFTVQMCVAGPIDHISQSTCITALPFCPQSKFDELLAQHDVLFVRGEDSFVRAQLAAKPMIWQIYPTEDLAHADKLKHFFDRYCIKMSSDCKNALWDCWISWNALPEAPDFSTSWLNLQAHLNELQTHAIHWRDELIKGPELVREILTWHSQQTTTLSE